MSNPLDRHSEWLNQHTEEIIDAERPIIDPHHHLWPGESQYLLEDLWDDTSSGHNIKHTVFIECTQEFLTSGPEHLKPVGETIFVKKIADEAKKEPSKSQISGIVSHADMTLGEGINEVLDLHFQYGESLFKGIRHAGGWDPHENMRNSHHSPSKDMYLSDVFNQSLKILGEKDLVFEAWQYHHQINQVAEIADRNENLTIILNHFSGPIGIGPYEGKEDDIFKVWQKDIKELSKRPNVLAKLGGLAMPVNGFKFHEQETPATSDQMVERQKRYYLECIESFEPSRCMFESNFPVDKQSISYHVLWNFFKKISENFSEDEKNSMFYGCAKKAYSI